MNLRSKLGLEVEYWLENSWWSIKLSMKGEVGCTWNGGGLPVTSQVSLVFGNVRHSIVCLHDWLVICCGIYHTTLIYPSMNCHNIQYKKNYKSKKLPHCCYCLWFYMEWHPPKQRIMRKCSMQSAHKRNGFLHVQRHICTTRLSRLLVSHFALLDIHIFFCPPCFLIWD